MTDTFLDIRLRVLTCDHCGAPLQVPIDGGQVPCGYCGSVNVVAARSAPAPLPVPADPTSGPQREAERLEKLRAQDGTPLVPPSEVRALMDGSTLSADKVDAATRMFRETRRALLAAPDPAAEQRLYVLALVFGNYLFEQRDFLRLRAILESTAEAMRTPRYQHVIHGELARTAVRLGELDAARAWLALLEPASDDLVSDSAYRLSSAQLALHEGRMADVLAALGRRAGDVPISDENDAMCAIYRAHAIEQLEGVDAAVEELVRASNLSLPTWLAMEATRVANAAIGVTLCPQSFERARPRVSIFRRSPATVPCGCTAVLLVVLATAVAAGLTSGSIVSWVVAGVVTLVGVLVLPRLARNWLAMRVKMRPAPAAPAPPAAQPRG